MNDPQPYSEFAFDAECYRRLGISPKRGRMIFRFNDDKRPPGWPLKQERLGKKRNWYQVRDFFRR